MTVVLEAQRIVKNFGGVRALDGADISVEAGTVHGLIGPNGSGKTTLLGVLAGTHRCDSGVLAFKGAPLQMHGAHRFVHAGIARTFQTTRLFAQRTLAENLRVASDEAPGRMAPARSEVLDVTALAGYENRQAGTLTNAEQRRAMIAAALSTGPSVMLLDEPAVGMSEPEADVLARVIRRIRDDLGIASVVVEHNMHFMMALAETVTVVSAGRVLAEGSPAEIRANADVISSYLGS